MMEPREIYDAIEEVWKDAAIHTMAMELIVSGAQQPNPAAFTHEAQHAEWNRFTGKLRTILDELEKLGKNGDAHAQ